MIIINKKIDIMKWMKKRQLRRNKNKFKIVFFTLAGLIILFGVGMFIFHIKGTTTDSKNKNTKTSLVAASSKKTSSGKPVIYPTIYITGSSGGLKPPDTIVQKILPIKNMAADKSLGMISNVANNYELTVEGEISKDNQYPLIEFGTGKGTGSGELYSLGLQKAISYLTERYDIPWVNMVGYSSGGTGAIYYMIDTVDNPHFPPVNKFVSLDGEYNEGTKLQYGESLASVLANGPWVKTKMYQYIEDNYEKISSKTEMMFLEGDFDTENQTDSAIPWADSFSVYHLLKKNGNEVTATLYPTKTSHAHATQNSTAIKYIKNFIYNTP